MMLNLHSRLLPLPPYCLGLLTQSQFSYYSSPCFHHRGQTHQKCSQIALYCPELRTKCQPYTHDWHEQILTASFFTLTEKTGTEICCNTEMFITVWERGICLGCAQWGKRLVCLFVCGVECYSCLRINEVQARFYYRLPETFSWIAD